MNRARYYLKQLNIRSILGETLQSKNFTQFSTSLIQNRTTISSCFEHSFDFLQQLDMENAEKKKVINCLHSKNTNENNFWGKFWDDYITSNKNYNQIAFETKNIVEDNIQEQYFEKLNYLKKLIVLFDKFSFRYAWEPVFISTLASNIEIDPNKDDWKKIKFFMLFGVCKNYSEYKSMYDFFNKLEVFLKKDKLWKIKIWSFWLFTLPFFIIFLSIFLPLGMFLSLLILVVWIVVKIFYSIHSKTSYKIRFNIWANIVIWSTFVWSLFASVFIADLDSYRSWYERVHKAVNFLSAISAADVLSYAGQKADISSKHKSSSQDDLLHRINKNYLAANFYTEVENVSDFDKINADDSPLHKWKEQPQKYYFSWKKQKIGHGVYIWNMLEQIYTKYNIEEGIYLSEAEKYFVYQYTTKKYINLNIQQFRRSSISPNSYNMQWNMLSKNLPNGFKIDMGKLEKIFSAKIKS